MGRSLLPWIALVAVALAALLFFVRDSSHADVGLDLHPNARVGNVSAPELASAARAEHEQRAPELLPEVTTPARPKRESKSIRREGAWWGAGVLEVRVVHDEDGRPFVGARVGLPVGFDLRSATPDRTTDADGLARFENLTAGAWTVIVEAEGCAAEKGGAFLDEAHPSARVELRLATRRDVLVRFVDAAGGDLAPVDLGLGADDVGVVGLSLAARCGQVGERFEPGDVPSQRARSTGTKTLPFRWNLEMRGRAPVCVHALLGDVVIAAEPVDPRAAEVLVRVDRDVVLRAAAPILVRVVSGRTEQPVAGVLVTFRPASGESVEQRTDSAGRARADGLVAGEIVVTAQAEGLAPFSVTARRPIEGELVLRLLPTRMIAGVLLDQAGAPMPRALVVVYPVEDPGTSGAKIQTNTVATDLAGRFEFAAQEAGRYLVVEHRGDWNWRLPQRSEFPADAVVADCRAGDVTELVVRGTKTVNDVSGPDWDPPSPSPSPR